MRWFWMLPVVLLLTGAVQDSEKWPDALVGGWAHVRVGSDAAAADTIILRLKKNGRYDKEVIRVRQGLDGPYVFSRYTLRRNLRWSARRVPQSEHFLAHDEICLEWRAQVSCGWYEILSGQL